MKLKSVLGITIWVLILVAIWPLLFAHAAHEGQGDRFSCFSNTKQIGISMLMYTMTYNDRMPDRRDLKTAMHGGYRPWLGWPQTDPRSGWLIEPLWPYTRTANIWKCRTRPTILDEAPQVVQQSRLLASEYTSNGRSLPENISTDGHVFSDYWMWGFDKTDKKVALDDFWGKTPGQILADLRTLNESTHGISRSGHKSGFPETEAQVEFASDPYFPIGAGTKYDGVMPHTYRETGLSGRIVGYLDGHAKFITIDPKTNAGAGPEYLNP